MSVITKQFIAAIALIRRDRTDGGTEWLALWNAGRNCHQFVEAHKLDDETFRQSLLREITWATGLRTGKDFVVAGGCRAHLQFAEVDRCGSEPVWFIVEFFLVELMGRRHRSLLDQNDEITWVTAEEIQVGKAADGRPLCPRLLSLLKQADILLPWQE
ncbi:MAG: hypothetical protein WBC44_06775 [Planctomycetaceae bacterium]